MKGLPILVLFLVLCPFSRAEDVNSYSDSTGRTLWNLQYWSLASNAEKCIPQYNSGWQNLNKINVQGTAMFGLSQVTISVNIAQKTLNVAFRGPDAATTFVLSGLNYLVTTPPLVDFQYGLKVAPEYLTTFNALWGGGLRTAINAAWDQYCDFKLLITGHSLGSCLGQMFSIKMNKDALWTTDTIQFYGWSSPRCGNQLFALEMDASSYSRYRINYQDYVVSLPVNTPCSTSTYPTAATAQECFWHCCWALKYTKSGGIWGIGATTGTNPTRCAQSEMTACTAGGILDTTNHAGFFEKNFGLFTLSC